MSHSVFTGRVVEPGEPQFLPEDTDGAIALAEEERDTCPSCGMPKAWCRDPAADQPPRFEAHEEHCRATYVIAARQAAMADQRDAPTTRATQTVARIVKGREPDLTAGLDLPDEHLGEHK